MLGLYRTISDHSKDMKKVDALAYCAIHYIVGTYIGQLNTVCVYAIGD